MKKINMLFVFFAETSLWGYKWVKTSPEKWNSKKEQNVIFSV